jgi:hypothetical protein
MGFALLASSLSYLKWQGIPTGPDSDMWRSSLGEVEAYSLVDAMKLRADNALGTFGQTLVANIFQVMVSFLYLFYNRILPYQMVAAEWTIFLKEKKSLRVSSLPKLTQRSTYALSLPWKYAIPLMVSFMILHWLISQSVFIVRTNCNAAGPTDRRMSYCDAVRVGFSSLGILLATGLGNVMLLALLLNSFRRYKSVPSYMPRMATDSAAINASCHAPRKDKEACFFPVKLVVVQNEDFSTDSVPRLTFSTDIDMQPPRDGGEYLLPHEEERKCRLHLP